MGFKQSLGVKDTETIVTYSVMMWYTQEFRNLFSSEEDLDTFTDLIIFETNDAYIKGNMPVNIQVLKYIPQSLLFIRSEFKSTALKSIQQ